MHSRTIVLAAFALVMGLGGCAPSYYKVTDPTTGKVYYTSSLEHKSSGAATLVDAKTGNKVSLQSSEIAKVSKSEFDVARYSPAPAEPKEKPAEKSMEPTPFK
jgi:hypothetical protein